MTTELKLPDWYLSPEQARSEKDVWKVALAVQEQLQKEFDDEGKQDVEEYEWVDGKIVHLPSRPKTPEEIAYWTIKVNCLVTYPMDDEGPLQIVVVLQSPSLAERDGEKLFNDWVTATFNLQWAENYDTWGYNLDNTMACIRMKYSENRENIRGTEEHEAKMQGLRAELGEEWYQNTLALWKKWDAEGPSRF